MWIASRHEAPPVEFAAMVDGLEIDDVVRAEVGDLLARKKQEGELGRGPRREVLTRFIESKLAHFEVLASTFDPRNKPASEYLDATFLRILKGN